MTSTFATAQEERTTFADMATGFKCAFTECVDRNLSIEATKKISLEYADLGGITGLSLGFKVIAEKSDFIERVAGLLLCGQGIVPLSGEKIAVSTDNTDSFDKIDSTIIKAGNTKLLVRFSPSSDLKKRGMFRRIESDVMEKSDCELVIGFDLASSGNFSFSTYIKNESCLLSGNIQACPLIDQLDIEKNIFHFVEILADNGNWVENPELTKEIQRKCSGSLSKCSIEFDNKYDSLYFRAMAVCRDRGSVFADPELPLISIDNLVKAEFAC